MSVEIDIHGDLAALDRAIDAAPNNPAVFLLFPHEGDPYLAKTALLRRRLVRLLKERERPSRLLNLRHTVERIEYHLTGSAFESAIVQYELARRHFPKTYAETLRLRMPPYVKLVLNNVFPRTRLSTHLSRTGAYYGPFRSRTSAEQFEGQFLDLFQIRRCQEDLVPSPQHPGCIYGEMSMCLRPCQELVGPDEYRHEVERVSEFLRTDGQSLLHTIQASRDRASEDMLFEDAARQHKRYEKVQEVLHLRDELARDLDHLHGIAITPAPDYPVVKLWFIRNGYWLGDRTFNFEIQDGKPMPMDRRLADVIATVPLAPQTLREREDYLALLARWYYSTWRDGEWLPLEAWDAVPYRKLVHAVSRVARRLTSGV